MSGEPSAIWNEAYAAKGPDRDDMFDWLEARCLAAEAEVVRLREALRELDVWAERCAGYHISPQYELARAALREEVSEPRARTEQIVPESASAECGGSLTSPVDDALRKLAVRVKSLEGAVYGSLGAEPGPVEP